ncbi:MAG: hypothetical protein PHT12_02140 [Patescibacteria group bacterium]|nr:hypothetical protein [Patescibacteria group bacterium]
MAPVISFFTAVIAGCLTFAGYWWYNRNIGRHETRPNIVAWFIWAVDGTLGFLTFFTFTGDGLKSFNSGVSAAICVLTFLWVLRCGYWLKPTSLEIFSGVTALVVLALWWSDPAGPWANVTLNVAGIIPYAVTASGVWREPRAEMAGPWLVWAAAGGFSVATVLLRWSGRPVELFGPVLVMICNLGVGLLATRQRLTGVGHIGAGAVRVVK